MLINELIKLHSDILVFPEGSNFIPSLLREGHFIKLEEQNEKLEEILGESLAAVQGRHQGRLVLTWAETSATSSSSWNSSCIFLDH